MVAPVAAPSLSNYDRTKHYSIQISVHKKTGNPGCYNFLHYVWYIDFLIQSTNNFL